jgi:hypothetical protein
MSQKRDNRIRINFNVFGMGPSSFLKDNFMRQSEIVEAKEYMKEVSRQIDPNSWKPYTKSLGKSSDVRKAFNGAAREMERAVKYKMANNPKDWPNLSETTIKLRNYIKNPRLLGEDIINASVQYKVKEKGKAKVDKKTGEEIMGVSVLFSESTYFNFFKKEYRYSKRVHGNKSRTSEDEYEAYFNARTSKKGPDKTLDEIKDYVMSFCKKLKKIRTFSGQGVSWSPNRPMLIVTGALYKSISGEFREYSPIERKSGVTIRGAVGINVGMPYGKDQFAGGSVLVNTLVITKQDGSIEFKFPIHSEWVEAFSNFDLGRFYKVEVIKQMVKVPARNPIQFDEKDYEKIDSHFDKVITKDSDIPF